MSSIVQPSVALSLPSLSSGDWQSARAQGLVTYRPFGVGELILQEGTPGDTMFFIEKGKVAFSTHDAQGNEIEFRTLDKGQFFGEVALLLGQSRSANARAKSEVFAYELHRDKFERFMEAHPTMQSAIMREMAHRLRTSGQMLHHTVTPGIAGEIAETRTPVEQSVQTVVRQIGSLPFLWINLVVFGVWIVANLLYFHWDTHEFAWLALFAAVEALLLTILVLAKQNRDEKDSDVRADRILQNTGTTETELRHLRSRIDALTALLHAAHPMTSGTTNTETPPPAK